MANLHKFTVTNKVAGLLSVDGGTYVAGDILYMPEHQVNYFLKSPYLINGLLEYNGEVEPGDTSLTAEFMTLYDAKLAPKKNILPSSMIKLATSLVKAVNPVGIQGADCAGGFIANRRMYVNKVGVKYGVITSGTYAPWFLVSSGDVTLVTPSILTSYEAASGHYHAATNGSITATAPITWASGDKLIIGYSEKFSSAQFDMTAASGQTNTATAYYWTAAGWKQFLDLKSIATLVDYTAETSGRTLSRAAAGDKARMVWWTQPTDWVPGGPEGSWAGYTDYCVGIQFSGALTTLAGCSVYPVLDRPLANIKLGTSIFGTEHYYTYKGTTWTNTINLDGWGAATDAIYISVDHKFDGLYVDMTGGSVNDVGTTLSLAYWNGVNWVAMTFADGTENPGGTPFAVDGWITITAPKNPSDWVKVTASTINSNMYGAGTQYWVRIMATAGGPLKAGTAIDALEANQPAVNNWLWYDVQDEGFVDAGDPIKITVMLKEANIDVVDFAVIATDL
jgi:hypothetical protein